MENSPLAQTNVLIENSNGNTDSGGLARWIVYSIIAVVAIVVIAAAVWYTRKRIQDSREDGSIIKEVGEAITYDVDKNVVDNMLEVAIRAQTESAQLNADMETAKQLFTLGQMSQADVDKAVAAAEASKTTAMQKNAEAAKALEEFRKKELSAANDTVMEATKKATDLSQEYEKVSNGITEQKVREANALLLELVKKRQQAESDYNVALDTKKKAEAAFLESKKTKAENRRGIINIENKKLADIKKKIEENRIPEDVPKPPPPPTPKPPPPDDGKKAFGDNIEEAYGLYKKERDAGKTIATAIKTLQDKYTGVGPASTKILEDRYIASKPPAPKPPTPKPPPPGPPSDLEKKYPYWGWGPNEGLRCANKDNTGCNTAYDENGNLYDTNPTPPPGPSPGNNPHRISDSALRMMGMDAEQLSNILAMIGGPEQSNVEWWKGVDKKDVYGYCENINDDRGVTIGVSGFVTKWGLAQKIVKDAGGGSHDVGQCRPGHPTKCSFCDWVRGNGSNQKFIDAQWNAYANEFMKLVPKYVPQQFKDNALIKGMMLDTAMNAGEFKEGNSWGLKEVTQAARGNDAASWAYSFLDARYDHFTAGNSQSMRTGRIMAWKKLVQDNKWDMKIDPCKYAFCSGRCLGC